MHAFAAGGSQAAESVKVGVVFVAIVIVTFWKVILRLVLALIAIVILVALGTGVEAFMHGAHL